MKSKKKLIIFAVIAALAIIACICVVLIASRHNDHGATDTGSITETGSGSENEPSHGTGSDTDYQGDNGDEIGSFIGHEDHISDDPNVNVFSLAVTEDSDDEVTVQLSLSGDVSLCRYSLTIQFDSNALDLLSYDEDLSVFSPVVYPGKNADGTAAQIPENGIINLEWANAGNVEKEGEIINITFEKNSSFSESTRVCLNVKDVNIFTDGIVSETDYNSKGVAVDFNRGQG